jgi:DNA topoisomerase III
MTVCIAEKPSVAREIAAILGARSKQDGYLEGNGYAVTWTFGHFCTLKDPEDYRADWKKWTLDSLPMLPEKFETKVMSDKGVKAQFAVIKKLMKSAKLVINCGDAGQEGELIQRWVLKAAGYKGPVQRLWISSLTAQAISAGFQNLKPASDFDNLFYAGSSRAIGDWLLGMNATRLYTLKYGGFKQVLSIGRVQTPTLAMIVARHHEIENFKPEPYWELHTIYREVDFHYEKGRFTKKEDGSILLEKITGKPFTIISSEKKEGKEYAPPLFDLTSLQVHCNKRFSFSANQTLQLVQSLYEKKVVTYPRVDTTFLPNDIYPQVPGILKQLTNYSQYVNPLLGQQIRKSSKVFNDKKVTDHHAIIPTGEQKTLDADEQKVYDAIVRQFLAVFYPDCLVANTTVMGEVEKVPFKATGKEILEPGWRVLFPKPIKKNTEGNEGKNEEEEIIMPAFVPGETGPHEPTLMEKMTQPPKHYTEATLLRAMETAGKKVDDEELRELMKANGIGRPSTRANIIETLYRRKYISKSKKQILATPTGVELIGTIKNELLKSAELTGQWEKKLREIEDGSHSAKQFIADMNKMVDELVVEVRMDNSTRRIAAQAAPDEKIGARSKGKGVKPAPRKKTNLSTSQAGKRVTKENVSKEETSNAGAATIANQNCPKCRQGKLLKGNTAYGCSRYKEGCNFRLPFEFMGKVLPENQLLRLLKMGSTVTIKGFQENGQTLKGAVKFTKEHALLFVPKEPTVAKTRAMQKKERVAEEAPLCPKCGLGTIVKGKAAYGCSAWLTGCSFRFPFEEVRKLAGDRELTRELVFRILSGGG